MLPWFLIAKLIHILSAFLLVGGWLGRDVAFAGAQRAKDVRVTAGLLAASETFEKRMVRPGSEMVFLFGLVTAWLEHLPVLGVLSGARPAWVLVSLALYLLTVPVVIAVAIPRTRRRSHALQTALNAGNMTTDLYAALHDRTVLIARRSELAIILVVIALMVLKPF
jgi:uncharacterized membrane protein